MNHQLLCMMILLLSSSASTASAEGLVAAQPLQRADLDGGMALAIDQARGRLAIADSNGVVRVLSLDTLRPLAERPVVVPEGTVLNLAVGADGALIASTDRGQLLWLHPQTLEQEHRLDLGPGMGERSTLHFSLSAASGQIAAVISRSHLDPQQADELLILDAQERRILRRMDLELRAGPSGVAWLGDGRQVAVSTWNAGGGGMIYLCDTVEGGVIRRWSAHTLMVAQMAKLDNRRLVSVSVDWTVKLWNTATGESIATMRHPGRANAVAVSPDGRIVAVSCWDGRLTLWSADDLTPLADLQVPGGRSRVAFTGDGTMLVHTARRLSVYRVDNLLQHRRGPKDGGMDASNSGELPEAQ